MTAEPSPLLLAPLERRPDQAWIRPGLAIYGWGEESRHDPGTGTDRFVRAREMAVAFDRPVFAAFTFDEDEPGSVVIVPEHVLEVAEGETAPHPSDDPDQLPPPLDEPPMPPLRLEPGDDEAWARAVSRALDAIAAQEVEKVVVARRRLVVAGGPIPLATVAGRLARDQGDSHTFLVDGLVGSSPELLISKRGREIRSLSLAGSADATDPGADLSLGTTKSKNEHSLAAGSVEEALNPLTSRLQRLPTGTRVYGDIRHLATAFEGEAVAGAHVLDLVAALHPTAAVAGTPTKAAVELIREIEVQSRGRYAGPVGWFDGAGDGEIAIALRCGLLVGDTLSLFSGVGLVDGSEDSAELTETELKFRPMLGALGLS